MNIAIALLIGMLFGGLVGLLAAMDLWKRPLTQQGERLRQQVGKLTAAEQDLRQRLRIATGREASAVRQQKMAQERQQTLQNQLGEVNGRYTLLQGRLDDLKSHNQALTQRLADEADKMSEVQMGLAGAKAQYQTHQEMIAELKTERQLLQSQLIELKSDRAERGQQMAQLQETKGALETEVKLARQQLAQLEELRAERRLQQARLDELKEQLTFGRVEQERLLEKLTATAQLMGSVEAHYHTAQEKLSELPLLQQKNEVLRQQVEEMVEEAEALHKKLQLHERDDLKAIYGIGPVYVERLQAAGVDTFAKLAEKTPEELREIVKIKPWQSTNIQEWIEEARQRTMAQH
ncbi:MAG: DUF4332 domain-containing protein [Anaerolineales bacterium]|nr:DUF4332 domain-containing protein [Anaerolineales bacterium]